MSKTTQFNFSLLDLQSYTLFCRSHQHTSQQTRTLVSVAKRDVNSDHGPCGLLPRTVSLLAGFNSEPGVAGRVSTGGCVTSFAVQCASTGFVSLTFSSQVEMATSVSEGSFVLPPSLASACWLWDKSNKRNADRTVIPAATCPQRGTRWRAVH